MRIHTKQLRVLKCLLMKYDIRVVLSLVWLVWPAAWLQWDFSSSFFLFIFCQKREEENLILPHILFTFRCQRIRKKKERETIRIWVKEKRCESYSIVQLAKGEQEK